jgi:rhodanese-related sulfurtransferase
MRYVLQQRHVRDELMESQIFLYGIIGIIAVFMIRKWWRQRGMKNYSPEELASAMEKNSDIVLLDVRTNGEHSGQHIPGSIHIPLHELPARLGELKKYLPREIVCYCQSGSRSVSAMLILDKNGFNAANLNGGISEWNFSQKK